MRSSTRASNGSRARRSSPARPGPTTETPKPASPRYSATSSARRASSSITSTSGATAPSLPAASVPAADALGQLPTLLGREHIGHVRQGLGESLRRLLGQPQLVGAQRFEGGP